MTTSDAPALPGAVFYLHAPVELQPVNLEAADGQYPREVNGQPAAYFWADGIRAGKYVHPAGKFELQVDGKRLDGWVYNFHKMREAGVDVPVPVDHSNKARDNLGYVVDVRREGQTLMLLHQLIGEDAIRLAARNKVSLGIDPNFTDGQGRAFGDCVVHSSLTPVPLVPGQEGLVPMSNEGAAGSPIFYLDGNGGDLSAAPAIRAKPAPARAAIAPRMDELVRRGHITPACRARLVELMDGRSGAGRVLLSMRDAVDAVDADDPGDRSAASTDDAADRFEAALVEALSRNVVVPLGEKSGVQMLSRVIPGEEPAVNAELQLKMVRMANGGG